MHALAGFAHTYIMFNIKMFFLLLHMYLGTSRSYLAALVYCELCRLDFFVLQNSIFISNLAN